MMAKAKQQRESTGNLQALDEAVKRGSGMRPDSNRVVFMTEFEDDFRVTCWALDCNYAPVNAHERMLVRRAAETQWALSQVSRMEENIIQKHLESMGRFGVSAEGQRNRAFRALVSHCANELGTLQKHEVFVARAFREAMNHLEEIQGLRIAKENKTAPAAEASGKTRKVRRKGSRRAVELSGEELVAFATDCLTLGEVRSRHDYAGGAKGRVTGL